MLQTLVQMPKPQYPIMDLNDLPASVKVVDSIDGLAEVMKPGVSMVVYPREFSQDIWEFGKQFCDKRRTYFDAPHIESALLDYEHTEAFENLRDIIKVTQDPYYSIHTEKRQHEDFHVDVKDSVVQTIYSEENATTLYNLDNKNVRDVGLREYEVLDRSKIRSSGMHWITAHKVLGNLVHSHPKTKEKRARILACF